MYTYWLLNKSSNSSKHKINVWFLSNISQFNVLAANQLSFLMYNLNKPQNKVIKTLSSNYNFDSLITMTATVIMTSTLFIYIFML